MPTLLYKDFLLLRKEKAFILVFFLPLLAGISAGAQPASALLLIFFPLFWANAYVTAYDFKYGSEATLVSLPVERAAIVIERYALSGAVALMAVALASLGGLVMTGFRLVAGSFPWGFPVAAISICLVYGAISLGAYFRFGYQSSRWVTILLFVIPSVLYGVISASEGTLLNPGDLSGLRAYLADPAALGLTLLAALGVTALSCAYSVRRFGKKEF